MTTSLFINPFGRWLASNTCGRFLERGGPALRVLVLVGAVVALSACGANKEERMAQHFESGMILYQQGDPVKARLEFKNVLQIDANHAESLYMLGRIAEESRNFEAAFQRYSGAVHADPHHLQARLRLGRIYLLGDRVDDALEAAENILEQEPNNVPALVLRGNAEARKEDFDGAMRDGRAALELDPAAAEAISLVSRLLISADRPKEAEALLEAGISKNPDDVALRMVLAQSLVGRRDIEAAARTIEELLALQPQVLEFRTRLAALYLALDAPDRAEAVLRAGVERYPESTEAKLALVSFLREKRGDDVAEAELSKLIRNRPDDYDLRFIMADFYLATGRDENAEAVYRQVLEIGDEGPKIDKARLSLARVLVRREELNQAQELVTQVLTNNPRNAEALILDGRIALERDDPGTAIAQFQGVLRDAPREVEVLRLLARAQFESGKQLLALDALNQAVDADPANVPARLELARLMAKTGDRAGAKAQYQAILERHPDQAVALEQMTKIQVGERDWGGAVKSAERAKAAYPDAGWPYLYTGMALIIRGAQQAGIRDLETAYARSPEDSKVLLVLVRSLISTGQVDVAVSTLNESLVENHNNVVARILLAEVLSQQGKVKEAEKQFEIAIENDPASERPYLAFARHQLGRGDTEQSARTFERGLKATGGSANILIELGVAYERLGEPERAIRILEQALNEEPEAKAAANNLAVLLATYRQDSASLDRAKLLAESLGDTRNPSFADTLGWVYLRRGDVDAAIPLLERALSAFPDSPEVHYHLGAAFEAKGEIESSRAHLKRALATSASFPGIEDAKARLKALGDG